MLEHEGYPFKSKEHSERVDLYQKGNKNGIWITRYLENTGKRFGCPKKLEYQFTDDCDIKISDKCCLRLKEDPLRKWQKENNKPFCIIGIMPDEGGRRTSAKCIAFKGKRFNFQPLVPVTKKWENWFISEYNIDISDIYKPPYNRDRTGCKGCPFAIDLQEELDMLEKFFPAERKQCEIIWAPVYAEYRRLGYRLKKEEKHKKGHQMTVEEFLQEAQNG